MTYHLPPEELKKAAEKRIKEYSAEHQDVRIYSYDDMLTFGNELSNHTMQTLTPTLDKALEALEMCKRKTVERIEITYFKSTEELEEELAKITEAINEIKKLKG